MQVKIPTITLYNKRKIPVVGLGTWKSKGNETYNIVKEAFRMGYRHIDCAAFYGNEKEIGTAIKDCLKDQSFGLERQDLYISSKLWNTKHRPACVTAACRKSLEDLGLDYLDLYLMHWPMAYQESEKLLPSDPRGSVIFSSVTYVQTWKAMQDLILKHHLVKSIGVCNFNKRQIKRLLDETDVKPVINQIECHPFLNQTDLKNFCNSHDIFITCFSPLGSRDRPWAKKGESPMLECDALHLLSKRYKKSPAQIALRYQIQRNNIVIPKTIKKERLFENASIFDFTLAKEDMSLIDNIGVKRRYIALRAVEKHPDYPFHDPF